MSKRSLKGGIMDDGADTFFADPAAILPSAPTPWSYLRAAGIPFPFDVTLQGIMLTDPTTLDLHTTNAVLLHVVP